MPSLMKSAIFGFTVPIHHIFSMQLDCSFAQAEQIAVLHFQWHGLTYLPLETSRSLSLDTTVNPHYCQGYELYVNAWEEEIDQTISQILGDYADQNPPVRIKRLRQALSYWWPKCEKTVALVQMDLAARDQCQTVVNIHLAWGKESLRRDTLEAHRSIREFTRRLKQLHIHYHSLIDNPGALPGKENDTCRVHDTTIAKLEELEALRNDWKRGNVVAISFSKACRIVGITPSTVKKQAPELYAHWYDPTY